MPTAKEFTISLEDKPGTLGKLCQALAEGGVNILAYQQFPHEKGKGSVRLVVDNPDKAKATLDRQRSDYKEAEVAQVKMAHRPGELGRASSRLGEFWNRPLLLLRRPRGCASQQVTPTRGKGGLQEALSIQPSPEDPSPQRRESCPNR